MSALRAQLIGLGGVVERNAYLIKRYRWWELTFFIYTCANTLTVVFIAKGVKAGRGHLNVSRETTTLLIGAILWAYLGIIFEILTETVAWERWEGTIEYTFMAPLSRAVHLGGMGLFAVLYGVVRTALLFVVIALFFGLHFSTADFGSALLLLAIASVSFIGLGMVTAVLPLISPEARRAAGVRRAGPAARRLRHLLPGQHPARVDALDLDDLARDLRTPGDPRRRPGRRRSGANVGRHLATDRARRRRHPDRTRRLPSGRAVRQAARQAQALRLTAGRAER
jgi:hypothetical protein